MCQVGYATAMDMYIILCLAAVFAALVEFACINFIDTFIKRFRKWEEEQKLLNEEKEKLAVANGDEKDKDVLLKAPVGLDPNQPPPTGWQVSKEVII